jgi:hypothetical protein
MKGTLADIKEKLSQKEVDEDPTALDQFMTRFGLQMCAVSLESSSSIGEHLPTCIPKQLSAFFQVSSLVSYSGELVHLSTTCVTSSSSFSQLSIGTSFPYSQIPNPLAPIVTAKFSLHSDIRSTSPTDHPSLLSHNDHSIKVLKGHPRHTPGKALCSRIS